MVFLKKCYKKAFYLLLKNKLTFLFLFVIFQQNSFSQNSVLWGGLKEGKYKVGFKYVEKYDESRFIDSGKTNRPLQISIWYPAEVKETGNRLYYKDYIALTAHEINFENSSDSSRNNVIENYEQLMVSNGVPLKAVKLFMNSGMSAYLNAKAVSGSFPLVIVGQGNFHPSANLSILCEYLASHGYYVATCASPTRITGQITDTTQIYQYALDQRDDMKFIFDELKTYANVDYNELGVIGYSFGGRSGFLLLNDFDIVKVFISLDSGFANKIGKHWLDGITINTGKITVPILHIYQDIESFVVPDFELVNSLVNSERYLIKVEDMKHGFFYNLGMAIGVIPGFDLPGVDKDSTKMKFETVNQITLAFLNTYLKEEDNKYWMRTFSNKSNLQSLITVKELKKGFTK